MIFGYERVIGLYTWGRFVLSAQNEVIECQNKVSKDKIMKRYTFPNIFIRYWWSIDIYNRYTFLVAYIPCIQRSLSSIILSCVLHVDNL